MAYRRVLRYQMNMCMSQHPNKSWTQHEQARSRAETLPRPLCRPITPPLPCGESELPRYRRPPTTATPEGTRVRSSPLIQENGGGGAGRWTEIWYGCCGRKGRSAPSRLPHDDLKSRRPLITGGVDSTARTAAALPGDWVQLHAAAEGALRWACRAIDRTRRWGSAAVLVDGRDAPRTLAPPPPQLMHGNSSVVPRPTVEGLSRGVPLRSGSNSCAPRSWANRHPSRFRVVAELFSAAQAHLLESFGAVAAHIKSHTQTLNLKPETLQPNP